ncbi:hypothetical protein IGX29_24440, partial [Streptomyces sp. H28]|uniref:hypothetical protein n=1 Tax=Streptomyces sp. H28 TaxID=2775865 RepID=UPI0017855E02
MSQLPTTATAPSTQPAPRHGVTVAIEASLSPLRNGAALDLWASAYMDEYSYEAVYDPARISLADAQASIRATLAEHNVQVADFLDESDPLTAAQRGPEWMARYGCT